MSTTIDTISRARSARPTFYPSWRPVAWAVALFDLLLAWQDRASARAHLAAMSDAELKDVGLSRADVMPEVVKPFWYS